MAETQAPPPALTNAVRRKQVVMALHQLESKGLAFTFSDEWATRTKFIKFCVGVIPNEKYMYPGVQHTLILIAGLVEYGILNLNTHRLQTKKMETSAVATWRTTEQVLDWMEQQQRNIDRMASAETTFTDPDVKRKFIAYCVKHLFNERIGCKDGIIALEILVIMGLLNLDHGHPDQENGELGFCIHDCFEYELDDDGRLVEFEIVDGIREGGQWYNVPADIIRLTRLKKLTVWFGCQSFHIDSLQKLHHLKFQFLHDGLFENFPNPEMRLQNLKNLTLDNCSIQSSSLPFFRWVAGGLPNLEHLRIFKEPDDDDIICNKNALIKNALRNYDWCFAEGLKTLELIGIGLDNDDFEFLFLDVIPRKFPNLLSLVLRNNNIQSIQTSLLERIKNDTTGIVSRSMLRRLDLHLNPIESDIENGIFEEKESILSLLNIFKKIYFLGFHLALEDNLPDFCEVQHALAINHAGRYLLEKRGENDPPIPLSLWPLILEKALTARWSHRATGLNHMLRYGPALAGRTEFGHDED